MAGIMTIQLNKATGTTWGFRLQGGKDFATPLCIQKVNVGSVSQQAGLQAGDAIVSIGGRDALSLRHKEAQDAIVQAGNNFDMVVQRGSQIWKPHVAALPEAKISDGVPVVTKTSLAANQKAYRPNIGSGHNVAPAPFELVNSSYNSPVNIYSEDSIAETLSAQAEVLGKGVLGINFKKYAKEEKIRTDSPTYKLLHGEEEPQRKQRPASQNYPDGAPAPFQRDVNVEQKAATPPPQSYLSGQSAPPLAPAATLQPGENVCFACQTLITGVFVRIKNKNLHADCFKCSTCGSSLKNVGYYNINERLYCDVHAKQAARTNPPAPHFEPVTVQPGAAPPPGAVTAPQASRMKVPAAFQHGGPAPAPAPARAPAPAPAPIKPFAPAPAPAPVAAAPMKPAPAPAYSTSGNPQGFGAPAGDINVRSHIPKKGQSFEWPPRRTVPEVKEEPHPPAWAPAGEIPSVSRPVKPEGPLPKRPPLLPTPPPPKDYDVIVMKSSSSSQIQSVQQQTIKQTVQQNVQQSSQISVQQSSQKTIQQSSQKTIQQSSQKSHQTVQQSSQSRSIPVFKPSPQQLPPPVASRFPNPAPALINLIPSAAPTNTALKVSHQPSKNFNKKPSPTLSASNIASKPSSGGRIPATKKPSISPPKMVPITEPMPSVKFDIMPTPKLSDAPKPVLPHPSTIPISPSKPKQQKQQQQPPAISGFKSVNAPTHKSTPKPSGGYNPVKVPVVAPIITPPVTSSLPASAPALSENVAPKPVPSNPPAPAGDVPAPMTFAPVSAPIPGPVPVPLPASNPSSNFGPSSMPKPVPPPGMGGKIGPGGPPARGVPQAPGHRSAPRRGRGVMNQASASRIPVCNACQRQIRGPFVSALGKTWCPDHFICGTPTCKRNIIDMGFVEEQGSLYCEVCYETYLAPVCGKCDKRIKGDCLNAVGKQFHPECFCCAYCGKVFGSGAFYLEDGLPYCETDWNDLFTTKCVGCNFPIEAGDRWVEALNNNYHSQCFKCSKCHKNLEGQSFFAKGGKPFCKAHAQRGF